MKIKALTEEQVFAGITEEAPKSAQFNDLEQKLYFDAVLKCQNRTRYEEDIKSLGKFYTYFTLDTNNLKFCNDNFSHESGDELLKITANAGIHIWGSSNFYRIGGDEFCVLINGVAQDSVISSEQLKRFKDLLAIEDAKYEFPIAVSVGFATSIEVSTFEEVVKLSDERMYVDKKIYKETHKEYDMRRARITSDSLKEALESGEFHKAYKELRGIEEDAEKEAPVEVDDEIFDGVADTSISKEIWSEKETPTEVDEDLSNIDVSKEPDKDVWNEEKKHTQLVTVIQEDLSNIDVHDAEEAYQSNEFNNRVQPVLKETTEKAVAQAVRYQNDKLKLEVAEVLSDEVSYRLSRYEKRRRRRDFREKASGVAKFIITVIVILFILGNQQLRLRFAIVFQDLGDLIVGLINGEEVSSNKLVHDIFMDMGDELNDVNTIRVNDGFTIDKNVETEESEVFEDDESREEKSNN